MNVDGSKLGWIIGTPSAFLNSQAHFVTEPSAWSILGAQVPLMFWWIQTCVPSFVHVFI